MQWWKIDHESGEEGGELGLVGGVATPTIIKELLHSFRMPIGDPKVVADSTDIQKSSKEQERKVNDSRSVSENLLKLGSRS